MTDSKTLWGCAAHAGLILGLVSSMYYLCDWAVGKFCTEGALIYIGTAVKIGLWITKFVTCIMLMKTAMRRFADSDSEMTNADTFRLGSATALLSAFIYSAFTLAFVLFIQPDIFDSAMDMLRDSPMMTEAAMEAVEAIAPKFPAITFFSNLIYCTLFGTVLSAILSRNIPSTNPFKK